MEERYEYYIYTDDAVIYYILENAIPTLSSFGRSRELKTAMQARNRINMHVLYRYYELVMSREVASFRIVRCLTIIICTNPINHKTYNTAECFEKNSIIHYTRMRFEIYVKFSTLPECSN